MSDASFLALVHNAALLLAMTFLFDIAGVPWRGGGRLLRQIPFGLALGAIGVSVMLTPWVFSPGIIFDTRSVLLGISGLFFGLVPTVIAMAMTAAYRLSQGGAAAWTGVYVIVATGTIGIVWRRLRRRSAADIGMGELYVFGLVIHVTMLALMLTLPWETARRVLAAISIPVLVIYPVATAMLGTLMAVRLRRDKITQDLLESQERLRLAVQTANIGFFEVDLFTRQEYYSPEWKQQLGYSDDEIVDDGREWQSRIHPDDLEAALKRENDYIEGLRPDYESVFRLRHKDGSYPWILSRGLLQRNADGKAMRLLGCHIDITRQKEDEEAIAASERRFRGLAESSQDYIMLYDRECRHVYENPAGLRVSGLSATDIIGKTHREADFSPELSDMWEADIQQVVAKGNSTQRLFAWDGTEGKVYLDWRLSPVFDQHGKVELVLGISRDITALKQAEQALRTREKSISLRNAELELRVQERTAQLEAANKELEAFAHSVSHDLRAPLRALEGFSAVLLASYPDRLDERGQHYLHRIQEASRRMGQLINDLLSLSRVTRTEFNRQKVDLSALAADVAASLQAQDPERQVQFDICPNLVVDGDPRLLRIVLENLLNNAYKFTSRRDRASLVFGATERDGKRVFFVRDNGVGFDMTYASKLFAPFQRLHSMEEFPGTGIGLVTVQRIITRHGGRIWPEAVLDQGATFYFTLGEADV